MGIVWENTIPSTELLRDFCAGIGPLQLGVVLVFLSFSLWGDHTTFPYSNIGNRFTISSLQADQFGMQENNVWWRSANMWEILSWCPFRTRLWLTSDLIYLHHLTFKKATSITISRICSFKLNVLTCNTVMFDKETKQHLYNLVEIHI